MSPHSIFASFRAWATASLEASGPVCSPKWSGSLPEFPATPSTALGLTVIDVYGLVAELVRWQIVTLSVAANILNTEKTSKLVMVRVGRKIFIDLPSIYLEQNYFWAEADTVSIR